MNDATHPDAGEQSPERVNPAAYDAVQAAVIERLESFEENPEVYDLDWIARQFPSPAAVRDLGMTEWVRMVHGAAVEDQTAVPCPPWCRYRAQHRYESEDNDGRQVRYHAIHIETPRGVDLSLTQEEKRDRGDDTTSTRGPVEIWLTAEDDHLDAAGALAISDALQKAATTLTAITSGGAL